MSTKRSTVLFWTNSISDMLDGYVYGIGVQLYFWAQAFAHHKWQVATFTYHQSFTQDGIHFKHISLWGRFEILHEWLSAIWNLIIQRPRLVVFRGAARTVFPLAVVSKLFGVRLLLFSASDSDFEIGKELIAGGAYNRKLWQKSVCKIPLVVVQNQYQKNMLQQNYGKEGLLLFNIWGLTDHFKINVSDIIPCTDVVWVANFRRLKRAEWVINAARTMSDYKFTLIGGPSKDHSYYDEIEQAANTLPNLLFLGKKSFAETNAIISHSKIVCCTSVFEGFPNTFLQAWSNGIPVISTVNPSNLIITYRLGVLVDSEVEFQKQIQALMQNASIYGEMRQNIRAYFTANHAADTNYKKLMGYIDNS